MEKKVVSKISRKVAKTFPEMRHVQPTIRKQPGSSRQSPRFVLTFKGKADLPGGKRLTRIVRVVADERGEIIRMSTSR